MNLAEWIMQVRLAPIVKPTFANRIMKRGRKKGNPFFISQMKKRLSPNRSVWMVLSLLCHSFLLKYHTNNDILIAIDFKYLMKWIWDSVKAYAQMRITICKWWLCVYFHLVFADDFQHQHSLWHMVYWTLVTFAVKVLFDGA